MIEKIDSTLLSLARKLVIAADFFGISLDKLVYGWVIAMSALMFARFNTIEESVFNAVLGILLFGTASFQSAKADLATPSDMLPAREVYVYPKLRISLVVTTVAILMIVLTVDKSNVAAVLSKLITLPHYYHYLVMNRGARSKRCLKTRLLRLIVMLKRIRLPHPAPQPLPQPS